MTLPAEPRNDAYARIHFPTGRKDMTDDTERDARAEADRIERGD